MTDELSTLRCRYGCKDGVFVIVETFNGCACLPDRIQALCHHHWIRLEPLGDCRVVYDWSSKLTDDKARKVLGDSVLTDWLENGGVEDGNLYTNRDLGLISWRRGENEVCLDGNFTAEQLEAVVYWMRRA
jgi:hypothetical protein